MDPQAFLSRAYLDMSQPVTRLTRWMTALALAIVALVFFLATAYAQTYPLPVQVKPLPGIILKDDTISATLEDNYYVIPDPDNALNQRLITERIITGDMNANLANSPEINLGIRGQTYWIVLPVTNVSTSDIWELDFGGVLSGRQSLVNNFSVYNSFSRRVIFESRPQNKTQYSIQRKVRFNLPVGQSGFIIVETRNTSTSLVTFKLALKPAYHRYTGAPVAEVLSGHILLMIAGVLLAAMLLRRNWSYGAYAAGWLLVYANQYIIDHYIFLGGITPHLLTTGLWLGVTLFFIAGCWLDEKSRGGFPASLFTGVGFLCLICGLTSFLVSDFMPVAGGILSYAPIAVASFMILALNYPLGFNGEDRNYLFQAMAGFLLLTMIATLTLLTFGVIPASPLLLIAPFILLTAAALSMAAFALLGAPGQSYEVSVDSDDEPLSSQTSHDLSDAKENSEHKRLLQVLDQERATMAQMQVEEARRTEEMRKAKEAADEANNAKSAFLAVVSHEIRTPMTGIMGMVRMMLDTSLSREQKEYATTIQDSGEALMALLNDILDFEKIESGKLELERVDFDLHRLLRGVQTLMNGHATAKNVELRLEMDETMPVFVVGDPTRLRQVMLNLVNNAIKFTAKGTVYLRVNDLTPEDKLSGPVHQIYFAVQDSGIGITPEVQKRLFMPFAQADSSTSRKYGGTGLGLAICKRLIEAMGGAISISSKANEGSTFFFTLSLPLGHESIIEAQPEAAAAPARKLHVLVVDDNGINQKVLVSMLEKEGHSTATASNGAEAIARAQTDRYDLILMDIEMPDLSGIEVTHQIRKLSDSAKALTPIVAMTGNTSERDITAYFSASMDDFLGKPITVDKLKSILQKAIGGGGFANQVHNQLRSGPKPDLIKIEPRSETTLATKAAPKADEKPEDVYVPVPPPPRPTVLSSSSPRPNIIPPPPKAQIYKPEFSFAGADEEEDEDTFAAAIQEFERLEEKAGGTLSTDLDEPILASLKSSLSPAQLEDLLIGFYEKAEELVAVIGRLYINKDFEQLGARAHELKGMAGNFGFKGVSALATEIEKAAKAKIETDLKAPVDNLGETYALSKARLTAWLK